MFTAAFCPVATHVSMDRTDKQLGRMAWNITQAWKGRVVQHEEPVGYCIALNEGSQAQRDKHY
jgi:hypothetical protein